MVLVVMVKSPASSPPSDQVIGLQSRPLRRARYKSAHRGSTKLGSASHSISANDGASWAVLVLVISGVSSTLVTVTATA